MKHPKPHLDLDHSVDAAPFARGEWAIEQNPDRLRQALDKRTDDPVQATRELENLAEGGSRLAMTWAGEMYSRGAGVPISNEKAEMWLRRAVDAGSVIASGCLGMHYQRNGRIKEAEEAYDMAASHNYTPALYGLGRLYWRGQGVSPDHDKAFAFWERAASFGHVYAIRNVAYAMIGGRYGVSNIFNGVKLWMKYCSYHIAIHSRYRQSELFWSS